jgi:nucleotidyltransferase/DNA polymerase involved in DNA repair
MEDNENITEICSKCQKERISVIDYLEFGVDLNSVVGQIRFEVEQATGLTCSAGRNIMDGCKYSDL